MDTSVYPAASRGAYDPTRVGAQGAEVVIPVCQPALNLVGALVGLGDLSPADADLVN